ncbi:serine/threonine-protein kinase [Streptomyces hydrogenans]|uniref:serine/threonine-protein kinase n=1 Tax=Streptomyces hydrogenans TaxID=1873719 RepID=UPI0035E398B5
MPGGSARAWPGAVRLWKDRPVRDANPGAQRGCLRPEEPESIGPYRLSARLGEGGMGQAFLGVSRSGRKLAVKVIRPQIAADPGLRERFRREVAAARTVGGFWTAPIVDADPDGPVPWVAGEYIDAPDLAVLVNDRGPLPEPELVSLAVGLAEALEAVHRAGLVHRDLKPSNILVTGDGPRVIDFGIAKAAESATALTGTGLVIGTPGFMSPEQPTGGPVGPPPERRLRPGRGPGVRRHRRRPLRRRLRPRPPLPRRPRPPVPRRSAPGTAAADRLMPAQGVRQPPVRLAAPGPPGRRHPGAR